MAIRTIKVANFKSFNDLEVELGNLNILIGANASGKSNFVQIFRFLKDISVSGLDNAVSMQGGINYFQNLKLGKAHDTIINVHSNKHFLNKTVAIGVNITKEIIPEFESIEHEFAMRSDYSGLNIIDDSITYKSDTNFVKLSKTEDNRLSIDINHLEKNALN